MTGLVTVLTSFPFVRTTFMVMIAQTAVATLLSGLFMGWELFLWGLSFPLRFKLLVWP